MEALADKLGIGDRFQFLGFVSDEDYVELYGRCSNVYFSPQDVDYGCITLEAFLSGKPVIAAPDSGRGLELVRHRVSGLIIISHDSIALGGAIEEFATHEELCLRMGQAGASCIAPINWDNVMGALLPNE